MHHSGDFLLLSPPNFSLLFFFFHNHFLPQSSSLRIHLIRINSIRPFLSLKLHFSNQLRTFYHSLNSSLSKQLLCFNLNISSLSNFRLLSKTFILLSPGSSFSSFQPRSRWGKDTPASAPRRASLGDKQKTTRALPPPHLLVPRSRICYQQVILKIVCPNWEFSSKAPNCHYFLESTMFI